MAGQFGAETDLSVWQRLHRRPRRRSTGWSTARPARPCRAQVRELVGPELAGWGATAAPDDTDRDRELRGVLFEAAGVLGADPDVETFARGVVARRRPAHGAADPSVLAAAIDVVADQGRPEDFDQFLARFKAAANPQEELRYLYALADFDEAELVDRLVAHVPHRRDPQPERALRAGPGHGQPRPRAPGLGVRARPLGRGQRALPVQQHRAHAGRASAACGRPTVADDVFAFFETHEVPQGDKQLAQHLERLEVNVALRARAGRAAGPAPRPPGDHRPR